MACRINATSGDTWHLFIRRTARVLLGFGGPPTPKVPRDPHAGAHFCFRASLASVWKPLLAGMKGFSGLRFSEVVKQGFGFAQAALLIPRANGETLRVPTVWQDGQIDNYGTRSVKSLPYNNGTHTQQCTIADLSHRKRECSPPPGIPARTRSLGKTLALSRGLGRPRAQTRPLMSSGLQYSTESWPQAHDNRYETITNNPSDGDRR